MKCTLDEEIIKQRLAQRLKQGTISDGRWEIFEQQKKQFDPVAEVPEANYVIIDTSLPLDENVGQVLTTFEPHLW